MRIPAAGAGGGGARSPPFPGSTRDVAGGAGLRRLRAVRAGCGRLGAAGPGRDARVEFLQGRWGRGGPGQQRPRPPALPPPLLLPPLCKPAGRGGRAGAERGDTCTFPARCSPPPLSRCSLASGCRFPPGNEHSAWKRGRASDRGPATPVFKSARLRFRLASPFLKINMAQKKIEKKWTFVELLRGHVLCKPLLSAEFSPGYMG